MELLRLRVSSTLVLSALTIVTTLFAGGELAMAQDARAEAGRHFEAGVGHYSAERYAQALNEFLEAYRIAPHPNVRVNIANCHEQLENPVQALFHYEGFLAEADSVPPGQRREVNASIRTLRRQVSEVTLRISPAGARVVIDNERSSEAPFSEPVLVTDGRHRVVVSLPGYEPETREFVALGGQETEIIIELDPSSSATPAGPAASDPTPSIPDGTTAGNLAGAEPEPVEVVDGGDSLMPVFIVGGASAALLVGALVVAGLASGANSDFEAADARVTDSSLPTAERSAAMAEAMDAADSANTLALVADVLGIASLAGGIVTGYLILNHDGGQEAAITASPAVSQHGGGFTVAGQF